MPAKKVPKPFIYEEEMSFRNEIRVQDKQEGNLESSGVEDEGDDHAALAVASKAGSDGDDDDSNEDDDKEADEKEDGQDDDNEYDVEDDDEMGKRPAMNVADFAMWTQDKDAEDR